MLPDAELAERRQDSLRQPRRMLALKAVHFDTPVARPYIRGHHFISGHQARGEVPDAIDKLSLSRDQPLQLLGCILEHFKVDFSNNASHDLDREPRPGYLMLVYLSSGTRRVVDDLNGASGYVPTKGGLHEGSVQLGTVAKGFDSDLTAMVREDYTRSFPRIRVQTTTGSPPGRPLKARCVTISDPRPTMETSLARLTALLREGQHNWT
ncbi:hypothetical protein Tdes44962_MAKER02420 [Teratosphaeria destructans]|uniref:Uncharacterized protein n=1 Tax=Teratosphaeria destructans TaxID=418781 RepID=A0A9W7W392_9PEZI|nr:hypothetical protein Tdes44962_MAKER02420 [Teratosphaeria destructans]